MTDLIFVTNNQHKISEMQAAIGNEICLLSLREVGMEMEIPEPFGTLEENARHKSSTIYHLSKTNCFSEDTGLEITALNGAPGVISARYAGDLKNGEANIDKVLRNLNNHQQRTARFRTIISLWWNANEFQFEGICEGNIIEERRGTEGFGYDAIFMPSGSKLTFAQMTMEQKNCYSHRRKAADKLVLFLQQCLHPVV